MSKEYQNLSKKARSDLANLLSSNCQIILPMVRRWAVASLLAAEKSFRRIMGYRDPWMLDAALREGVDDTEKAA